MASRRSIRVKEWPPSSKLVKRPTPSYLESADSSLKDEPCTIQTDPDGFILSGRKAEPDEPPPRKRLYILGDSFVESVFVSESLRFPAVLERELRREGQSVQVLNAGYSGATTLHLLNLALNKIGIRPGHGAIVFVAPSNDAICLQRPGGFWNYSDQRYSPILPSEPEHIDRNIKKHDTGTLLPVLSSLSKQLDVSLILGTFPHRRYGYARDSWLQRRYPNRAYFDRMRQARRDVNQQVRDFAEGHPDIPFLDLEARFSRRTELFYDDLHLNEAGSAEVGAWLSRRILRIYKQWNLNNSRKRP